jgi:hypothetical protein
MKKDTQETEIKFEMEGDGEIKGISFLPVNIWHENFVPRFTDFAHSFSLAKIHYGRGNFLESEKVNWRK